MWFSTQHKRVLTNVEGGIGMELSDRKKVILQSIIEEYIENAEPVGSRTISKRVDLGLSSATIRNEMADLEELGYLLSPHTSAGRIPSDAGYRFYVNELMHRYRMDHEDVIKLRRYFTAGVLQLDRLIHEASRAISGLTNYTTIAVTPELRRSYVKRFELVPVDPHCALLVLITNDGVVKNRMINTEEDESALRRISAVLNDKLAGLTLEDITMTKLAEIEKIIGSKTNILMPILQFVHQTIGELNGSEIYVENPQHILNHPEYHELAKAKQLIALLEDKESVKHAIEQGDSDQKINIVIGQENEIDQMKDTSLVTAKYLIGDRTLGKIGIVGPTRMNYAKVVSALGSISESLDEIINEIYNAEKGRE